MAVYKPYRLTCKCGATVEAQMAESVNAGRFPAVRKAILERRFHRATCGRCDRVLTLERPFFYTDLPRGVIYHVLPRRERHHWKSASQRLDRAAGFVPNAILDSKGRQLRVVFGMEELREKLVAQDAGLDDRLLELLKVLLVYEHPFLLRTRRLNLTLDSAGREELGFVASHEHTGRMYRARMPRWIVEGLAQRKNEVREWARKAHPRNPLFGLGDHWVSMMRWAPVVPALDLLESFAKSVREGEQLDVGSPEFKRMLSTLPRGSQLPDWAKRDLHTLFGYVKQHGPAKLQDELFEIRFGVELEDDWARNQNLDDIETLWQLLKDLPDTNVEGNTALDEILLESGGGGWYDRDVIGIGSAELSHRERFEDVMRHEVGHAVQQQNEQLVGDWLRARFGWHVFQATEAGVDEWVGLMGGWGGISATQRREVRGYLQKALGPGSSWRPGPMPAAPADHPWNAADFGPRLAYEQTGADWYLHYDDWYRHDGKAFFLNFWYAQLMAVDETTIDLIHEMPDDYAAMSDWEFFAELYALYYDLDDPKRGVIPADVADWMQDNVGTPAPGGAPHATRRTRGPSDHVRPSRPGTARRPSGGASTGGGANRAPRKGSRGRRGKR